MMPGYDGGMVDGRMLLSHWQMFIDVDVEC
jgi:hypothetical protein